MADRYWIATTQQNHNNTSYWSTTSGGSGGASVPGASDKAIFDSNGHGDCYIAATWAIQALDADTYTGTFLYSKRVGFTVDGGAICRIGDNATIASMTIGTITDMYLGGIPTPGIITIQGSGTVHNVNKRRIEFNPTSTATITFGSGFFWFESSTEFGAASSSPLTIDNTVNSTPIYLDSGFYYWDNVTWNDTGGIYPGTDWPTGGICYLVTNGVSLGPVIVDPSNFTVPSSSAAVLSDSSSPLTCTYFRDCYGMFADIYASGIVETGVDPNPCRNIAIIGSAAVAKL